ncbi:MAG: hypothetical protein R6V85_20100 [Polyangia bacterium]
MKRKIATMVLLSALLAGCDDGGGEGEDGGTGDGTDQYGAVEVSGAWDGAAPETAGFRVAIFECPFSMPPELFVEGDYDPQSGQVQALAPEVDPGQWCLMAYLDMDTEDGLAPVDGLDAVNDTGQENASGAIPIEVRAGQTTSLELTFAI